MQRLDSSRRPQPVEADYLQRDGRSGGRYYPHRLPELSPSRGIGPTLVTRAVGVVLALFGALVATAVLVMAFVRANTTVSAPGTLRPVQLWDVRSAVAGRINRVLVQTGDTVTAGQPLLQLDSLKLGSDLMQLRGAYRTAELEYQHARATLPVEMRKQVSARERAAAKRLRARALLRDQFTLLRVPGDLDSLIAAYRTGTSIMTDRAIADLMEAAADSIEVEAQVRLVALSALDADRHASMLKQLQSQIAVTADQLEHLMVRSPAAGIVMTEGLERLVGAAVSQGEILLEVSAPTAWRADLLVSEQDVHDVHVGDSARVELTAFNRRDRGLLHGRVTSVAQAAAATGSGQIDARRAYRVTVQLDEASVRGVGTQRLREGYTLQGWIVTGSGRIAELLWRYLMRRV